MRWSFLEDVLSPFIASTLLNVFFSKTYHVSGKRTAHCFSFFCKKCLKFWQQLQVIISHHKSSFSWMFCELLSCLLLASIYSYKCYGVPAMWWSTVTWHTRELFSRQKKKKKRERNNAVFYDCDFDVRLLSFRSQLCLGLFPSTASDYSHWNSAVQWL